jgi:hypothetical protein
MVQQGLHAPTPASAACLAHLEFVGCWMAPTGVPVLAEALAGCSVLTYLARPQVISGDQGNSAHAGMHAGAQEVCVCTVAALAGLRHLALDGVTKGAYGWVGLTQLTALECDGVVAGEARAAVLGIAALTGLRRLQFGFDANSQDQHYEMQMINVAVAGMAHHWHALTRLTTLDLSSWGWPVDRSAAARLSIRLAPLAHGLVPVHASPLAQREAPLKPLAGGGSRLDLAAIGLDDEAVSEEACAAVLAEGVP